MVIKFKPPIIKFKPPISLILCSYLLASLLFFPQGIDSRILLEAQDDGKGQIKAQVPPSRPVRAPSFVGQNSPPTRTEPSPSTSRQPVTGRAVDRSKPVADCGRGNPYRNCIP